VRRARRPRFASPGFALRPVAGLAEADGEHGHRTLVEPCQYLVGAHAAGRVVESVAQDHDGAAARQSLGALSAQIQGGRQCLMQGGAVVGWGQLFDGGVQGGAIGGRRHARLHLGAEGDERGLVVFAECVDPGVQCLAEAGKARGVERARDIDQQQGQDALAGGGEGGGVRDGGRLCADRRA
jgi:hypothetical protein